jgi:hypothetical protein
VLVVGQVMAASYLSMRPYSGLPPRASRRSTIVGSFPQPDRLIDGEKLAGRFTPRVRAKELWRVAAPYLQQAWEAAMPLAIRAQEDAGLDIITDGEIRRESDPNRFATALEGVDLDNSGTALDAAATATAVVRTWPASTARRSRRQSARLRAFDARVGFLVLHWLCTGKATRARHGPRRDLGDRREVAWDRRRAVVGAVAVRSSHAQAVAEAGSAASARG